MENMLEEVEYCQKTKKEIVTAEDNENKCHICSKECTGDDIRVRDHCYITGK